MSSQYLLASRHNYGRCVCPASLHCSNPPPSRSKRNIRGGFKCSASGRHQVEVGSRVHARLLLSWPKSTMCCSGCSCWATRASGRRACCGGSPRVSSTPLTSPPSVGRTRRLNSTRSRCWTVGGVRTRFFFFPHREFFWWMSFWVTAVKCWYKDLAEMLLKMSTA